MQLCARSERLSCAFAAIIGASVLVTPRVAAQRPSREYLINRESAVNRTFRVASGPNSTFDLRNVHGSIRVIGSDGDEVELAATKHMSADSDDDLAAAER